MWDAHKSGVGPEEEFDFIRVGNADRLLRRAGPVLAAVADREPSRPTKISGVGAAPTIDIKVGRCRGRGVAHVRATAPPLLFVPNCRGSTDN